MTFSALDLIVFVLYCCLILGLGLFVAGRKGTEDSEGYFLASKSLPWWAIGTSLIAANISAEQMIGMSGSGYAIGLGIASYEWMAALTLILVAKYMLPIFIEKDIYTMPQFLEDRFDGRVRVSLAVFWILVYIFVNLTSVLYLGALSMNTIFGIDLFWGILVLAAFSAIYTIYGGLTSVAWTDVVQVTFLVIGGLVTTWFALDAYSGGAGAVAGLGGLIRDFPGKFEMILEKGSRYYDDLPGIWVIFGGLWVANISYWGFNQYIIQRALAAKNLQEAQRGMIFAGYLKMLMPLIVVIPGIAAFGLGAEFDQADKAYPWVLGNFVVTGLRGLTFAALIAAIASSLSSMTNSTSTIFTLDIYKTHFEPDASEKKLVLTGRVVSFIAISLAVLVAPLLNNFEQAFQFIQEFTGFISPGVVAIFLLGFYWKKATANGALVAAIGTIPLSWAFKVLAPGIPFLNRMGIVFLVLCGLIALVSWLEGMEDDPKAIRLDKDLFRTGNVFNMGAIGICGLLAGLYLLFW